MNKAFVKESDQDDELDAEPSPLPPGGKNYLTRVGYERLREELLGLIDRERPEVVKIVSWAASNGDRSENGDYIYGKRRLREIDRRIRFLTQRLDIAEVVDPAAQENVDRVYFGATVVYRNDLNEQGAVTIVGVDEAEPLTGRISWVSPMASALLRGRVNDVVALKTPDGVRELEILEIHYPDSA
jgi:transcription elongation factor GreB